jgi:hypothetical protein
VLLVLTKSSPNTAYEWRKASTRTITQHADHRPTFADGVGRNCVEHVWGHILPRPSLLQRHVHLALRGLWRRGRHPAHRDGAVAPLYAHEAAHRKLGGVHPRLRDGRHVLAEGEAGRAGYGAPRNPCQASLSPKSWDAATANRVGTRQGGEGKVPACYCKPNKHEGGRRAAPCSRNPPLADRPGSAGSATAGGGAAVGRL